MGAWSIGSCEAPRIAARVLAMTMALVGITDVAVVHAAAPPSELLSPVVTSSAATDGVTSYPSLDAWYGWQLVVADQLVAAGMFWTAVGTRSEPLLWAYVAFGIIDGPILHLLNDNGTAAWQSFLLRLLPPATAALGAYIGSVLEDGGREVWRSFSLGVIIGAIIGWELTAAPGVVVDYVLLSWNEERDAREPETEHPQIGIAPIVAPTPGGGFMYGLGLRVVSW